MGIYHENVWFSSWKDFKKYFLNFFLFPFASLANPCPEGSVRPLLTMTALCCSFFCAFSNLLDSRSYFSRDGNVSCSSKQSPLRPEGATTTEDSTIVWTSSNLRGFFVFFQEKKAKSLILFPGDIPLWSCIYMNVDWKAEHKISESSYSEQQSSCEPLGAKHMMFFLTLPQRIRRARKPVTLLLLPLGIAVFCLSCQLIFVKQRYCRFFFLFLN